MERLVKGDIMLGEILSVSLQFRGLSLHQLIVFKMSIATSRTILIYENTYFLVRKNYTCMTLKIGHRVFSLDLQ